VGSRAPRSSPLAYQLPVHSRIASRRGSPRAYPRAFSRSRNRRCGNGVEQHTERQTWQGLHRSYAGNRICLIAYGFRVFSFCCRQKQVTYKFESPKNLRLRRVSARGTDLRLPGATYTSREGCRSSLTAYLCCRESCIKMCSKTVSESQLRCTKGRYAVVTFVGPLGRIHLRNAESDTESMSCVGRKKQRKVRRYRFVSIGPGDLST
jgi:hypothetical protein